MNNAEDKFTGLVHPTENSLKEEIVVIKQHLQNAGFSADDSNWLVDVFKMSDCFGDSSGDSLFREKFTDSFEESFPMIAEKLNTESFEIAKDRQTRLALLFSCMLNFGIVGDYPIWFHANIGVDASDNVEWIKEFLNHANFQVQELDCDKLSTMTQLDGLLSCLFPTDVPYDQIVDLERLEQKPRLRRSSNDKIDFVQLEFWFSWRFKDNDTRCKKIKLEKLHPFYTNLSDDVLGEKILGLINAIDYAMWKGSISLPFEERLDPLNDGWKTVASELIPFLELLNNRKPESVKEPSTLLKAWWHLARHIFSWSMGESELSEDLRSKLLESASRHLGILRSVLRDTPEKFEDSSVFDFYNKAFYVLLCFAPPWKRIRPLLLAFTEMTKQAVASDLRTWKEIDSSDDPPAKYSRVPNWIEVAMYPQNLKNEIKRDPYLQELREEFAKFCLGRLRTKERNDSKEYKNEDFVEPRPEWRQCYVQALKALRVNPGGRGHKALFWLLNNDPNETVRELAKKAHKQVRHLDRDKPNLDAGASPRRPLFEAFWWLRQAHLITLGIKIDHPGAMRTRRKELHRTREKDDRQIVT